MDEGRARRMVEALRGRGVMAHVVEAGVYEFGIRVVLDTDIEALWDVDGAAGLDAEIVGDGVLIGFVPHVPGSERINRRATARGRRSRRPRYTADGLSPPAPDRTTTTAATDRPAPAPPAESGPVPPAPPPVARYQRRAHWIRRGSR
ncbi:hypothetical protein SSCG_02769 [Streptomyces clavuligerus]|nr:hypothetical protein [Streptomyces clavuligerus]EDY49667.1 hypothetical protein SSCG_02769 [Streptomyces clavuligerus]